MLWGTILTNFALFLYTVKLIIPVPTSSWGFNQYTKVKLVNSWFASCLYPDRTEEKTGNLKKKKKSALQVSIFNEE